MPRPRASYPPARGRRLPYVRLPAWLRRRVNDGLGSPVARAVDRPGGFSPGVAAALTLADGRRAFLKAVSEGSNPESPRIHRREIAVTRALPASVPAPRLLWSLDEAGWVAFALEFLPGREPRLPWRPADLRRVIAMLDRFAREFTPAPIRLRPFVETHPNLPGHWGALSAARADGTDRLADVDPWAVRHLDRLVELEARCGPATRGDTLVHCDVRADNLLVGPRGAFLVDWPHACLGPPWLDWVLMLPSVAMQGGPAPERLLRRLPAGRAAPAEDVDAVVAAFAGFLVANGRKPDPPGLPTLRAFQRGQAAPALAWLRERAGGR